MPSFWDCHVDVVSSPLWCYTSKLSFLPMASISPFPFHWELGTQEPALQVLALPSLGNCNRALFSITLLVLLLYLPFNDNQLLDKGLGEVM